MAARRTLLVIVILLASSFVVLNSNEMVEEAEAYKTPNSGVTWDMATLASNSGGAVFEVDSFNYIFQEVVTISPNDVINVDAGIDLYFDKDVSLFIEGTFNVIGTESDPVVILKNDPSFPWGGIHFNASSTGEWYNVTVRDASTGIFINDSAPIFQNIEVMECNVGISINDNAVATFTNLTVNNTMWDGIVCTNSTLTIEPGIFYPGYARSNITSNNRYGILLTNSNAYLNHTDIYGHQGYGITMVNCDEVLLTNINITNNAQGLDFAAGLHSDNSNFTIRNSIFNNNLFGGMKILNTSIATLQNNTIFDTSFTAIFINNSNVEINDTLIDDCHTGLHIDYCSGIDVYDITINAASNTAIIINHTNNVTIDYCTVDSDLYTGGVGTTGIHINHSKDIYLNNTNIYFIYKYGLHIYNSSFMYENGIMQFIEVHGMYIMNSWDSAISSVDVFNTIRNYTTYIVHSRNITFQWGCTISADDNVSVCVINSTVTHDNTTISYGTGLGLLLNRTSHVVLISTDVPKDRTVFLDNTSTVKRYWYLKVFVSKPYNEVFTGATLKVNDSKNQTLYEKIITEESGGLAEWLKLYESLQDQNGTYYDSVYTAKANYTGLKSNYTIVNMTMNRQETLWLYPNLPPGDVTGITPTSTHNATPRIEWNEAVDPNGDPVKYQILIGSEFGSDNITNNITANLYYDIPVHLNFTRYYINISAIDSDGMRGNYNQTTLDIINNKPTSPEITFEPDPAYTTWKLYFNITKGSIDEDEAYYPDELVRYTVKFYKDGNEQTSLGFENKTEEEVNHTEISSSLTAIGQNWTVVVTPYDGHNTTWRLTGADGAHSNGTPVRKWVVIGNRAPYVSSPLQSFSMWEDTTDNIHVNLKNNFTEPDGQTMTFAVSDNTIPVNINQGTGVVTFSPAANWYGRDEINFTASDGTLTTPKQAILVTVMSINDAPVLDPIDDMVVWEDIPFGVFLHGNDTETATKDLTFVANFSQAVSGLIVTETSSTYGKKLTMTADNSMVGNYTIRYTLQDGSGATNSVVWDEFKLQIVNTNDPPATPTITAPADGSKYVEGTPITFNGYSSDDDTIWGDKLSYWWHSSRDGNLGSPKLTASLTISSLSVGTHTITFWVTDDTLTASSTITVIIDPQVIEVNPTAKLVSPANVTKVTTQTPTLTWSSTHEKASQFSYKLKLDTNHVPQTVIATVTDTSYTIPEADKLNDETTYYWTIVPIFGTEEGVCTNGIFNFYVDTGYVPENPTVTLSTPANDATVTTTSVELDWTSTHPNKGEFTYDVYWDTEEFTLSTLPSDNKDNVDVMEYTLTATDNTQYWWTVIPIWGTIEGTCVSTPPVWTFKVDKGITTAYLVSPAHESIQTSTSVELSWDSDHAKKDSLTYDVYWSTSSFTLSTLPSDTVNVNKLTTTLTLTNEMEYWWTVIPDYGGVKGICVSDPPVWSFEINEGAEIPEINLKLPINEDIVTTQTVTLKWSSVGTEPDSYDVYISEDPDPALYTTGVLKKELTYTVTDGKTYYWKVIPWLSGIEGKCLSGVWSFSVDFGFKPEKKINITGGIETIELKTGSSHTTTLTLENAGNVPLQINIEIDDDGLGGVTTDKETITLAPKETATVNIVFSIPEDAAAGTYNVVVDFTPEGDTEPLATEDITVTVPKKTEEGEKEAGRGMLIGIAAIVIILIVLVLVFLMMKSRKGREKEPEGEADERKEVVAPEPEKPKTVGPAVRKPPVKGPPGGVAGTETTPTTPDTQTTTTGEQKPPDAGGE
ncbi:MAG: right-handed parallel beta-helix repeat-containing protein [Thermoplasmata archaeon]|nr:MAG: right-handed parallel beta-helix repeat-containing protein [Thermoplasmata archaeon]